MIRQPIAYLLLNGSIVILVGLLNGLPLKAAIVKQRENVNAWRVAHSVLVMDGLLMLIVGITVPHLFLDGCAVWVLVWSLIAAGYGFVAAFSLGALKGIRGLTVKPYGLNTVLFAAHLIGAAGSLVGVMIMTYGSLRTFL
jgi:hypothetical protein